MLTAWLWLVTGYLSSWFEVVGLAATAIVAVGGLVVDDRVVDPGRLLPLVVPAGYFPSFPPARVSILPGLDVVFGEAGDGVVGYVRAARLEATGLTAGDAERIALGNLCRRAQQRDVTGRAMAGDDGEPGFILWGGRCRWLAASSLLLPGLRAIAQRELGDTEICAAIPHRDTMVLFGVRDRPWRDKMQALITEKEADGRKPITRRLIRLLDAGNAPYYQQPSFAYLE